RPHAARIRLFQPRACDEAEARHLLRDCLCALNGSRRAGESQNETVPGGIDFLASEVLHFAPYDGIMVVTWGTLRTTARAERTCLSLHTRCPKRRVQELLEAPVDDQPCLTV